VKLNLSLGQMDVQLGRPEANLAVVRQMAAEAARRGSDLLVLPELWSTGYDLERAADHAAPLDRGIFAETAALARELGLAILGSCLSLLGPGQYGNTAVLFGTQGQILGSYSKAHLFRLMEEERYLTAGDTLGLVDTAWGRAGLAICYDLRFPELFRAHALAGAEIIFLPSEWPHPRLAHWRTMLRARAIENESYVVGCNRVGESRGTHFFGHSTVLDPWGETVIEAGQEAMLLTVEIDLDRVAAVRQAIPVFDDRRPDVYALPAGTSSRGGGHSGPPTQAITWD
jgi:omega-amidase